MAFLILLTFSAAKFVSAPLVFVQTNSGIVASQKHRHAV